ASSRRSTAKPTDRMAEIVLIPRTDVELRWCFSAEVLGENSSFGGCIAWIVCKPESESTAIPVPDFLSAAQNPAASSTMSLSIREQSLLLRRHHAIETHRHMGGIQIKELKRSRGWKDKVRRRGPGDRMGRLRQKSRGLNAHRCVWGSAHGYLHRAVRLRLNANNPRRCGGDEAVFCGEQRAGPGRVHALHAPGICGARHQIRDDQREPMLCVAHGRQSPTACREIR